MAEEQSEAGGRGDKVTDKAYFGTGLGIAVRQGNTDLQQKFNAALEK